MVVQGHRFDIIENVGYVVSVEKKFPMLTCLRLVLRCWPSIYVTPVTVPMVFLPPILINLVSMVYACESNAHHLV